MKRVTSGFAVMAFVLAWVVATAGPAAAKGSWMYPVADSYERGEEATLVGYGFPGSLGWFEDGPFFAYLVPETSSVYAATRADVIEDGWPLGRLTLGAERHSLWAAWRVSLTFTVPYDARPGSYLILYCNDPCARGFGDLEGGLISVGVDPPMPFVRQWPLDEPEIANLSPDALISGPGFETATAAQVQAGQVTRWRSPEPALLSEPPIRPGAPEPTTTLLAPVSAPVSAPETVLSQPVPDGGARDDGELGLVALGVSLAAVVVLGVLLSLRVPRTEPVRPPEAGGRDGSRSREPARAAHRGR